MVAWLNSIGPREISLRGAFRESLGSLLSLVRR